MDEIFRRSSKNPILTARMWPYPCHAVFNPGVVKYNGNVYLLCRVETVDGFSHLTLARSQDGLTNWQIAPSPTLLPDPAHDEERWGIEDPRIVYLEDMKQYAVTSVSFSAGGPLISLYLTSDFASFRWMGPMVPPEDKDGALFPRKFNGEYCLIHRPIIRNEGHIWISSSPDLLHWGHHQMLLPARGGQWDSHRVGLGCPPIETEEGWILIYHGVRYTTALPIYRVGLALLDRDDPRRVIARTPGWVFAPTEEYERMGNALNVVFPTGYVQTDDPDTLLVYYGCTDTCISAATVSIGDMLTVLRSCRI